MKKRFFYPSDLVNTKTTIPLKVSEERWIYIYHYSPPVRGIVVKYIIKYILEIVITRAAPAFHNLFMIMGCVFDINTVHKTVKKLTFQAFY